FELTQPLAGKEAYLQGHIPGAFYADLNQNLSAQPGQAKASGGRHPLPERTFFAHWLGQMGMTAQTQVVAYDRNQNMFAGRLWWMCKWLGHEAVAVLDGGFAAWLAAGYPVQTAIPEPKQPSQFSPTQSLVTLLDAQDVLQELGGGKQTIVDARAAARFSGQNEPIDPVAGHIPGARNRPFTDNLQADGRFKPAQVLRQEFEALLEAQTSNMPTRIVHQCGSGVSALPNLLAMELAGLGRQALYAGSWSD
ncbi:unnamed protein product, partial [Darwinula stevensoni]